MGSAWDSGRTGSADDRAALGRQYDGTLKSIAPPSLQDNGGMLLTPNWLTRCDLVI